MFLQGHVQDAVNSILCVLVPPVLLVEANRTMTINYPMNKLVEANKAQNCFVLKGAFNHVQNLSRKNLG